MKLILCLACSDVFKLDLKERKCSCGECKGAYEADGWHAWYSGFNAVPLGILNSSIKRAIASDVKDITAFIFEEHHTRFKRIDE